MKSINSKPSKKDIEEFYSIVNDIHEAIDPKVSKRRLYEAISYFSCELSQKTSELHGVRTRLSIIKLWSK